MTFAVPTLSAKAFRPLRAAGAVILVAALAACAAPPVQKAAQKPADPPGPPPSTIARYKAEQDGKYLINAVNPGYLTGSNSRQLVHYTGSYPPGSIVVDPYARRLYYILDGGKAIRYGVAVGRAGLGYQGNAVIRRKAKWPGWRPTNNMLRTEPDRYGDFAEGLEGGPYNPLGARALYLYHNGRDTYYRIHGTSNPSSIGRATSAGCIRLFNQDIIDLFSRVKLGTKVHIRTKEESLAIEGRFTQDASGLLHPLDHMDAIITGPEADKILMTDTDRQELQLAAENGADQTAEKHYSARATDTAALDPTTPGTTEAGTLPAADAATGTATGTAATGTASGTAARASGSAATSD